MRYTTILSIASLWTVVSGIVLAPRLQNNPALFAQRANRSRSEQKKVEHQSQLSIKPADLALAIYDRIKKHNEKASFREWARAIRMDSTNQNIPNHKEYDRIKLALGCQNNTTLFAL